MQINYYYLLIVISLLFNATHSESTLFNKNETLPKYKNQLSTEKDQFYIIIVENPHTNDTSIKNSKRKRELNDIYIDNFIDEINTLIVENKDTYETPEKLDELDNEAAQLEKRDNQESYALDYGDSNYVYRISSTENKTAIYAFLSNALSKTVDTMPHVISCQPDTPLEYTRDNSESVSDLIMETNWRGVAKKTNARQHLSLISQGKFDDRLVNQYDDTYYYPSSAGKDINIVFLDTGFNFDYHEFEDTDREVQCVYYIKEAKAISTSNKKYCFSETIDNHGTWVSDVAAGKKYGVAPKANVYGVLLNLAEEEYLGKASFIAGLEIIKSKLIKPYKTVLNISLGYWRKATSSEENIRSTDYILDLLKEISTNVVIVVGAGNEGYHLSYSNTNLIKMYCYSKDVICVGGIDNSDNEMNIVETSSYRLSEYSNYGEYVDIYAPFNAWINNKDQDYIEYNQVRDGTSYSSAIVSGVAATIMSDQNNTNYNTQSMLKYLKSIAIKDAISGLSSDSNNLFINNGKHVVYSKDNIYHGCGVNSGNQKCSKNNCCSKYGFCGTTNKHCEEGCQRKFGTCST